jgi:hypothetical protein
MAWILRETNGIKYYSSQLLSNFPWLVQGFSTRWEENAVGLNFGSSLGEKGLREAYKRFFAVFGLQPDQVHTVRQVHGDLIITIDQFKKENRLQEADGLMTNLSGVGLATLHADCVPVIIVDPLHRAVAAIHAGWKGTLAGIVKKAVKQMHRRYGTEPVDCRAAIGPAIGECCYQVSAERYRLFWDKWPEFKKGEREDVFSLNLVEINKKLLLKSGLRSDNIDVASLCTSCHQVFYSYRRAKESGRMLSLVALK